MTADRRAAMEEMVWAAVRNIPNTRSLVDAALDLALEEAAKALDAEDERHAAIIVRALKGSRA